MRLAQLARKIGITQGEIVEVLTKSGFHTQENGNTKLGQEEIDYLYAHYKIDTNTDSDSEDNLEIEGDSTSTEEEEVLEQTADIEEIPDPLQKDDMEVSAEDATTDEEEPSALLEQESEPEIIRAKKVKLEGIKVVGKIDLPELVEPKEVEKPVKEEKKEARPAKRHKERRKGRKKPSYSEKVKKEEQRAERERKKTKQLIKEKKKRHYFEKVQPKVAATPKKKTSKKKFANTAPKKVKPQYKNPIRKFWAWLNGEYDV